MPTAVSGAAAQPPGQAFAGGLWSAAGNAIWPLARLELLEEGIRVRGVRWLVPAWQARYQDLAGAQLIAAPLASRGVYVQAAGTDPIVFWSRRAASILDCLQLHGVPVGRSPIRLPWGANTYHP